MFHVEGTTSAPVGGDNLGVTKAHAAGAGSGKGRVVNEDTGVQETRSRSSRTL